MTKKGQKKKPVTKEKKETPKVEAKEKVTKPVKKTNVKKEINNENGLIAALLLIIAVLSIALVVKIANPDKVETNSIMFNTYDDRLIQVENKTELEVKANLFGSKRNLGVLLTTKKERNELVTLSYKVIDENDKEVASESTTTVVLGEEKSGYCFSLPELDGVILKRIIIEVTTQEFAEGKAYNVDAFTSNINKQEDENKNINLTTNWQYHGSEDISQVTGLIVAMKENKIVDMGFFRTNIENKQFTTNTTFANQLKNNELLPLEYDSLEAFVTFYE